MPGHPTPAGPRPGRPTEAAVVVIGAGIIGLATARALALRGDPRAVVVLDKEPEVGLHQSGHNSGVVHAGVYYPPGSRKAELCTRGRIELEAWCRAAGVPRERCGKVVVATRVSELAPLQALRARAEGNGLAVRLLDRRALAEVEPHADGVAALHVPATGVVDFAAVTRALADELRSMGVTLALGQAVTAIDEGSDGVRVATPDHAITAARLVNCAGLHSDRVARLAGVPTPVRIVAFRGEYHALRPERAHLVRHLIYPVPDPRFPFLGVHLSRGIDGGVHVGPNAVLALAREGYRWADVSGRDLGALARDRAAWRLGARHWRTGLAELARSADRRRLVRDVQRLVPDVGPDDLVPAGAGVRAQAVADDGRLVDDFALIETPRSVHVLNAPSPGATASFAIGRWVADRALGPA